MLSSGGQLFRYGEGRGKVKIENGKLKGGGAWIVIFEGIWN